jgi:hypothetical protein
MKAVDAGPGLKNALGVNIDLNGFPRGARAAIKQSVDIFKQATLNGGGSCGWMAGYAFRLQPAYEQFERGRCREAMCAAAATSKPGIDVQSTDEISARGLEC